MSYNGSGTFQINTSGHPVVAGTVISSTAFNALTADLATGLSTAITKDGQTTTTARIPFAAGINSSLTTDSSSTTTGSIITAGGVGIAKALYVGTTANVASTTDSSSISTGAIVTAGGAGIAKNLYVGVNANVAGTLGVTGVATFSAAPIYSSLTASSAVATDASKGLVSVTNTGTGNNVLATSPTITTPTISSLSSASATALTLQSAGTTAITVDTSQNVGIGTSSPGAKLDLRGANTLVSAQYGIANIYSTDTFAINKGGSLSFGGKYATDGSFQTFAAIAGRKEDSSDGGWAGYLQFVTGTTPTERMRIDSSGNVGIGTSSPAYKLDVSGTGRVTGDFYVGSSTNIIYESSSNLNIRAANSLLFNTNGANERMRIDSSGNLLVGTTSQFTGYTTNTRLTVSMPSGSSGTTWEHADSTGGSAPTLLNFLNSSNTRVGYIASSGTATSFSTSSDYRLKNSIIPMTGALAKVALLKPCTYKWNVDGSDGQGFIAHELQEVIAGCVTGEKDAVETYIDEDGKEATRPVYQGIDTSFLVATLTAAIQELNAKFEEYKAAHP